MEKVEEKKNKITQQMSEEDKEKEIKKQEEAHRKQIQREKAYKKEMTASYKIQNELTEQQVKHMELVIKQDALSEEYNKILKKQSQKDGETEEKTG